MARRFGAHLHEILEYHVTLFCCLPFEYLVKTAPTCFSRHRFEIKTSSNCAHFSFPLTPLQGTKAAAVLEWEVPTLDGGITTIREMKSVKKAHFGDYVRTGSCIGEPHVSFYLSQIQNHI